MASPQLENGYTQIANELIDALCRAMPGFTEGQIVWAIIRKTYGWKKKTDNLSISQLCKLTGKSRRMIIYAIQNLEAKKMIKVTRKRTLEKLNEVNEIALNKNYFQWVVQEKAKGYDNVLKTRRKYYKEGVVQEKKGVVQELVNDVRFLAPTKETTTKETIREEDIYSQVSPGKGSARKSTNEIPFKEIISYLNTKTERAFRLPKSTKEKITARWNEGYRYEDFMTVIDNKTKEWFTHPKYSKYLRPETLFGTKFEGYVNEKGHKLTGIVSEVTTRTIENLTDLELD